MINILLFVDVAVYIEENDVQVTWCQTTL